MWRLGASPTREKARLSNIRMCHQIHLKSITVELYQCIIKLIWHWIVHYTFILFDFEGCGNMRPIFYKSSNSLSRVQSSGGRRIPQEKLISQKLGALDSHGAHISLSGSFSERMINEPDCVSHLDSWVMHTLANSFQSVIYCMLSTQNMNTVAFFLELHDHSSFITIFTHWMLIP